MNAAEQEFGSDTIGTMFSSNRRTSVCQIVPQESDRLEVLEFLCYLVDRIVDDWLQNDNLNIYIQRLYDVCLIRMSQMNWSILDHIKKDWYIYIILACLINEGCYFKNTECGKLYIIKLFTKLLSVDLFISYLLSVGLFII